MPLAKILLGAFLANIVHLTASALAAICFGATVREVTVGFGPVLRRFQVRNATVIVRLFLLTGYTRFWQNELFPARDEPPAPEGVRLWDTLPRTSRAAAQLAAPFAILLVSAALLRSAPWKPAYDGAIDFFRGAFSPTGAAADLVARAVTAARELPLVTFLGLVFAKLAGLTLIPLPSLALGSALLDLFAPRGDRARRRVALIKGASQVPMLVMLVVWLVGIATFLTR